VNSVDLLFQTTENSVHEKSKGKIFRIKKWHRKEPGKETRITRHSIRTQDSCVTTTNAYFSLTIIKNSEK
jgi:hypothetical protein